MISALFQEREGEQVRCLLCPHRCLLPDGAAGRCLARRNRGGTLIAESYGQLKIMRFFFGRLGPVGDWMETLVAAFRQDFGDAYKGTIRPWIKYAFIKNRHTLDRACLFLS